MAGAKRYDPDNRRPPLWKGLLLYFLPIPLLFSGFSALSLGSTTAGLARFLAFGLIIVAAILIRKGLQLEAEAKRRRLRRRISTTPFRLLGAGVLALAVFVLAGFGLGGFGLLGAILLAGGSFAGSYLYYGFDGSGSQADVAAVGITSEEVIELLDEAEGRIQSIERSAREIRNTEFRDRLRRIVKQTRGVLETIEKDPVDARRARKFLKVYLDGAQQVTEGYARTHKDVDSPLLEDNFRRVLGTIESVIEEQKAKLAENNLNELDVQIGVLQMQIEKEGVT